MCKILIYHVKIYFVKKYLNFIPCAKLDILVGGRGGGGGGGGGGGCEMQNFQNLTPKTP